MACKDCFNNCPNPQTDRCVEYTGEDIPILGICTGDSLSFVEAILIEKLISALDGTGITFETLTIDCDVITDILNGEDQTLASLMQALMTNACDTDTRLTTIETKVNAPFTVNASCLTLPTTPTRDDVLKAVVGKTCELDTNITTVITDYVKASDLCAKVTECLAEINDGNTDTVIQEFTKMPKYVYMAYDGPLTVFDSSGKGVASSGYDKVYLANGNNGTKDLRGREVVGANTNVVGGTLDTAVDPSQIQNAGYSIVQGSKQGAYTNTLTVNQLPAHSFTVPPFTFNVKIPGQRGGDNSDNNNTTAFSGGDKLPGDTGFNFTLTVPVTTPSTSTSSVGGGQPHNNLAPTYGVVWIIYIP